MELLMTAMNDGITAGFIHCEQFGTEQEADAGLEQYLIDDAKQYTKFLTDDRANWPDKVPRNCRYVFAYVGHDLTPYPDFYKLPLDELIILLDNFPSSVRFPSLDELSTIKINQELIIIHDHAYSKIEELFTNQTFIRANTNLTPEKIKDMEKIIGHKLWQLFQLLGETFSPSSAMLSQRFRRPKVSSKESEDLETDTVTLNQQLQNIFDQCDPPMIDLIRETLTKIHYNIEIMRENHVEDEEISNYIANMCQDIPELAKVTRHIIGQLM
jgi:hypothetical protein